MSCSEEHDYIFVWDEGWREVILGQLFGATIGEARRYAERLTRQLGVAVRAVVVED